MRYWAALSFLVLGSSAVALAEVPGVAPTDTPAPARRASLADRLAIRLQGGLALAPIASSELSFELQGANPSTTGEINYGAVGLGFDRNLSLDRREAFLALRYGERNFFSGGSATETTAGVDFGVRQREREREREREATKSSESKPKPLVRLRLSHDYEQCMRLGKAAASDQICAAVGASLAMGSELGLRGRASVRYRSMIAVDGNGNPKSYYYVGPEVLAAGLVDGDGARATAAAGVSMGIRY